MRHPHGLRAAAGNQGIDEGPVGEPFGGGFFAGYISHTANGSPTHSLVVAPRATGAKGNSYPLTPSLQWKTTNTATAGTASDFDGAANTAAMVTAGIANHPAAQFCVNLNIGGFTDWYLPSRYEMEIAYYYLKPTTGVNNTSFGSNPYSVPRRNSNYTTTNPAQTTVTAFNTSEEAFVDNVHWTSTEVLSDASWWFTYNNGNQTVTTKTGVWSVRAFRKIAL